MLRLRRARRLPKRWIDKEDMESRSRTRGQEARDSKEKPGTSGGARTRSSWGQSLKVSTGSKKVLGAEGKMQGKKGLRGGGAGEQGRIWGFGGSGRVWKQGCLEAHKRVMVKAEKCWVTGWLLWDRRGRLGERRSLGLAGKKRWVRGPGGSGGLGDVALAGFQG